MPKFAEDCADINKGFLWNNYLMLSALCFVLTGEIIISLSANTEATSSPGILCWVSSPMKKISHLLPPLKLYGQNQHFIFWSLLSCTSERLVSNFGEFLWGVSKGVCKGIRGVCTVLASPNDLFGIAQVNVCIKLRIPLKHPYWVSCFCLR